MKAKLYRGLLLFSMALGVPAVCVADNCHEESADEQKELDVSADVRIRGDFVRNQSLSDFSFQPDTKDKQVVSRTRLSLSHETAPWLKTFVQGQFYGRENSEDYSQANLYQAFFEFTGEESFPFALKIGRQELCYGSTFFVGANDFYDGLTWDGVTLKIFPKDNMWLDIIGARYVRLDTNVSESKPALYGIYGSYESSLKTTLDVYFFQHRGGFSFFHEDLPDSPQWFTIGSRIAGKIQKRFDYEIEPLYQFGEIDNPALSKRDSISAFGGHLEGGYTFDTQYQPRLFAGYVFGSGDSDETDTTYREFHGNVYNDNYLVGDVSLVPDLSGVAVGSSRASGMNILVAGLSADLSDNLNINVDYHHFLAARTEDGISRSLGDELNLIAGYSLLERVHIMVSANKFFTGEFFKDAAASTEDITYYYAQTQIEF